jgi:putative glutamine amidotransferase
VVGHAPDGTIEAVEKDDHPWLVAVQWHPELTADEDARQQRLFDSLVTVAGDMSVANKRS